MPGAFRAQARNVTGMVVGSSALLDLIFVIGGILSLNKLKGLWANL